MHLTDPPDVERANARNCFVFSDALQLVAAAIAQNVLADPTPLQIEAAHGVGG